MKTEEIQPVSEQVHSEKHRMKGETFSQAMARVAHAISDDSEHGKKLYDAMKNRRILPGGRTQLAMGSGYSTTAFNCYVSRTIEDSMEGIMKAATEAALTLKMGGGIGYDFSTIRPKGSLIRSLHAQSSGAVSFMSVFNSVASTISSAGNRRGAQMGVLRIDHPDVKEFINTKNNTDSLNCFNISVAMTDEFMEGSGGFDLRFGSTVYETVDRDALMSAIMRNTWDWGEPGVLFIDRINEMNNLNYCETISATNPCGEQPLPPFGACLLASLNLVKYVRGSGDFDWGLFADDISILVNGLDNVIDRTSYPLKRQEEEARDKRRMGIGITGFANASEMLGISYGSDACVELVRDVMEFLANHAYRASASRALVKGSFSKFDKEAYLQSRFVSKLDRTTVEQIERYGIRNSHLVSIAPTGTISLTADNVSSGIEPPFSLEYERVVIMDDGPAVEKVYDHAWLRHGIKGVTAMEVPSRRHIDILAAAQEFTDSAVSKTVNVGSDVSWDDFADLYRYAYSKGCKGLTTFRSGGKREGVLRETDEGSSCRIDPVTGERSCE